MKTPFEKNGISSNSSDSKTAPSNELSGSFSDESFYRDQSFLSGATDGKNFNIFQVNLFIFSMIHFWVLYNITHYNNYNNNFIVIDPYILSHQVP